MTTAVRFLHWQDVVPSAHPFDRDAARPVIARIVEDGWQRRKGKQNTVSDALKEAIEQAIDRELLAGEAITFEELARWQGIVLGLEGSALFRTTDAFAMNGRELYAFNPYTRRQFEACLAEANDPKTPVIIRAARAYLDVCFFHPFHDGNARYRHHEQHCVLRFRRHAHHP